jgi:hypothetical protein
MPTPNITGFTTGENLGIGKFGLNSTNGSTNNVFITGDNMAQGLPVNVTNNAGVTWNGRLSAYNSSTQCWPASLACANSTSGMGGSQNVDVTVGSGNETSPKKVYNVPVGP